MGAGTVPPRSRTRRRLAQAFVVVVLVGQAVLAVRGYTDPHSAFGYQPFPESSTWQAEIVRVTADDHRVPVTEPWNGYEWNELVHVNALQNPFSEQRHAYSSVEATLHLLTHAMDWIATHTPADRETRYLEARVTYFRNREGPQQVVLRSVEREVRP